MKEVLEVVANGTYSDCVITYNTKLKRDENGKVKWIDDPKAENPKAEVEGFVQTVAIYVEDSFTKQTTKILLAANSIKAIYEKIKEIEAIEGIEVVED